MFKSTSSSPVHTRRVFLVSGAALALAPHALSAADAPPPRSAAVGQVRFSQIQLAFMWSGSVGGGVLTFEGREHPFSMGGVGYGGIGASRLEATGEVYGLKRVEDFEGAYAQVRYGAVAGSESVGELWLQNVSGAGIELRLESRRQGVALSLGGDAVYIRFD
jgi:hypothetical protein